MSRSSAVTTERVNEVFSMLISGLRREQIISLVNSPKGKHRWGVSPRTVDNYIAKAKVRIEAEADVHRKYEFGKVVAQLGAQFAKADARHDHRACTRIIHEEIELLGLRIIGGAERSEIRRFLDLMEGVG